MVENDRSPIIFFAKRDVDDLRVEGDGSSDLPSWIFSEESLNLRSQKLISTVSDFKKKVIVKEKNNDLIPLVIKTKVAEDREAKTHRKEVSNLFRVGISNNILGLADSNEILIKLEKSRETDVLLDRLKNTERYKYALSCIENIDVFKPEIDESDEEGKQNYKVKLINYQNYKQNKAIRRYFEDSMTELNLVFRKTEYTPDHIIYNLQSVSKDDFQQIKNDNAFEAVFSIEPMPKYKVTLDMGIDDTNIEIDSSKKDKEYTTVGILDNGITTP